MVKQGFASLFMFVLAGSFLIEKVATKRLINRTAGGGYWPTRTKFCQATHSFENLLAQNPNHRFVYRKIGGLMPEMLRH